MAVPVQDPVSRSIANGVTSVFPYDFMIFDEADLLVTVDGIAQTLNVDYSVSGVGNASGGDVTFLLANPDNGAEVVRERNMEFKRDDDYQTGGDLIAGEVNRDYDRPIMMLQQLGAAVGRALKLPISLAGSNVTLTPEALKGLRWDAAGTAIENYEITGFSAPGGSDLVGFQQSGTGMVLRTVQAKGRDIVHADDRGLVGAGSDETTALQNLLDAAAGKVLMLGNNKTYGIGAAGLTFPANTTLISNGSKFKKLSAGATPAITVGNDCVSDLIELEAPGGGADAGVYLHGNNINVGEIVVHHLAAAGTTYGVYIGESVDGSTKGYIHVGSIKVTNNLLPVTINNARNTFLDHVDFDGYIRGIYIRDSQQIYISGGNAGSMDASGSATGGAGQNAILIESVQADDSTQDIFIRGFNSRISPEHGYRIGGQKRIRNVHFTDCVSMLPGSGSAPVGGSGFKFLGTNTGVQHEMVFLTGCLVEDAGVSAGANYGGFVNGLINGLVIQGCIVRKRTRTFSAHDGFHIDRCSNVQITGGSARDCGRCGLIVQEGDGAFVGVSCGDIVVSGTTLDTANTTDNVIIFDCKGTTIRRVVLDGVLCSGGGHALTAVAPTGAGAYQNITGNLIYADPDTTTGTPTLVGTNTGFVFDFTGPYYGTFAPQADNGSIYKDRTNGLTKIRKAGAWVTL